MSILTAKLSRRLHQKAAKRLPEKADKRLHGKAAKRFYLEAMIALCIVVSTFTGLPGFSAFAGIPAFAGLPGFFGVYAYARDLSGLEYQVKAAFIYNFAKFVEWPQATLNDNNDAIILSIASTNPENDTFSSLNNKTVGGKKLKVTKYEDIKDLGACHILFLDSTDRKFIQEVLKIVKDRSVLTVGHINGFTQDGGIINFFISEGKLRFEVNLDAAKRCGIKLGSQILMSAEIITEEHK